MKTEYTHPIIDTRTRSAVLKQLKNAISIYDKSGIIKTFENRFASLHNKKYALLTNSGTSALHSMFVGANLKVGDEVICPAYTFYATVTPLFFTGALPVLVDCGEDGNIDPYKIEKKITCQTKAIIVTHMWGLPCNMDKIVKIAKKYNLLLFEDASHAFYAKYKNKLVGTFGDAAVFSLQGQKVLTGGEGGILLTDNSEIFYRALLLGHYNKRCINEIPKTHSLYKFAVTGMGLKLRIHPLAAAIANDQLNKIDWIIKNRNITAKRLIREFSNLKFIKLPIVSKSVKPSWYAFIIQYDSQKAGIPLEKLYQKLIEKGCTQFDRPNSICPLNYHPLFQSPEELFPAYRGKLSYKRGDFPIAEAFHESLLKLPVWYSKHDKYSIEHHIKFFKKILGQEVARNG